MSGAPAAGDDEPDAVLGALRAELEGIGSVPVEDRVALFERANDVIARDLAELDEV